MKRRLDPVDEEIARLLETKSGKVGYLHKALSMNKETLRQRLDKGVKYGLYAHKPYQEYRLTKEGETWLKECEPAPIDIQNEVLDPFLSKLPTEGHRALFRLAADVVIAKKHLLKQYSDGWPGFMVFGGTGLVKSKVGEGIIKLFRLDRLKCEVRLYPQDVTPGNPGFRRGQIKGSHWTAAHSFHYVLPFLLLDEYDKLVAQETKRSVISFLDDRTKLLHEDKEIVNHAVPYLTANWQPGRILNDNFLKPYFRRCFAFNADYTRFTGTLIEQKKAGTKLENFLKSPQFPHLNLETTPPQVTKLTKSDTDLGPHFVCRLES